jgi:hypothetical protein
MSRVYEDFRQETDAAKTLPITGLMGSDEEKHYDQKYTY